MPGGLHAPLEVLLAWPAPNHLNPETRPNTITILACILGPITVGMLLARLWVRIFHQRKPGWDDWLMLAAIVPVIALTVIYPLATANSFGQHIWDLDLLGDPEGMVESRKYVLASECIFCFTSGLIKVSILLFYRRLGSRAVSRTFRWATWISIGFIVAYSIALILAPILGCQPISAFWDQVNAIKILQGYEYHCFDEGANILAAGIISAVQDFVTAALPTLLYWNLQIPLRQKTALFGIFAIGYGVVALGAVRAYYSWRTFYDTYDVTWSSWDIYLTSMLELHIGCFCANAPALKVFFKHFFHEKIVMRSKSRSANNSTEPKDSAHSRLGLKYAKASTNVLSRFNSLLTRKSNPHKNQGYISDNQRGVSVDPHGGVHVQREIHITHSPSTARDNQTSSTDSKNDRHASNTTADMIIDHYYDDIELGRYTTGHNSRASSMRSSRIVEEPETALPPMPPMSPMSAHSMWSLRPHPKSSTMKELPRPPVPAVVPEDEKRVLDRSPFPSRSQSLTKPNWQTWS